MLERSDAKSPGMDKRLKLEFLSNKKTRGDLFSPGFRFLPLLEGYLDGSKEGTCFGFINVKVI